MARQPGEVSPVELVPLVIGVVLAILAVCWAMDSSEAARDNCLRQHCPTGQIPILTQPQMLCVCGFEP